MPDVDGIAVLTALRDRGVLARLPVVVVTGLGDRGVRQQALALGAVDFMTKPFDRVELACKARNLTELGRLRAAALAASNAAAAASQLQRVEAAVHGLPIVVFEMAGGAGAWAVGDIRAQLGVGRDEMVSGRWVDTVVPADRDLVQRRPTPRRPVPRADWGRHGVAVLDRVDLG
jgi:CheY-like chemotaxis protein